MPEVVDGIDSMTSYCAKSGTDGPVDAACAVQSCIDRPVLKTDSDSKESISDISYN